MFLSMKTLKKSLKSILMASLLLTQVTPDLHAGRIRNFVKKAAHSLGYRFGRLARMNAMQDEAGRALRHALLAQIGAQRQAQIDRGIQAQKALQEAAYLKYIQHNADYLIRLRDLLLNNTQVAHYLIEHNKDYARFFAQINDSTFSNALDDYDNGIFNCALSRNVVININKIDVTQFYVRVQGGFSCGSHAIHNLLCFILPHGHNEDFVGKLLEDNHMFNVSNGVCLSVNRSNDFYDHSTSGDMVRRLLAALEDFYHIPETVCKNITVIEDANLLKVLVGDPVDFDTSYFEKSSVLKTKLERQAGLLRSCGEAQYFLVCSHNHWIPLKFESAPDVPGGVRVFTANSFFNCDVTNLDALNRIYKLLTGCER